MKVMLCGKRNTENIDVEEPPLKKRKMNEEDSLRTTSLLELCRNEEWEYIIDTVRKHVQNWDFKEVDEDGNTPLLLCCKKGALEVVQKLYIVISRVYFEERNHSLYSPLLLACESGNIELVKWLLTKGSSIDELDSKENYCELVACKHGQLDLVKYFTRTGLFDKNRKNMFEDGPVTIAAENGHLELLKYFKLLIPQRIQSSAFDDKCFKLAAEQGHLETVKWLIENNPLICKTSDDCIVFAIRSGNLELVKFLDDKRFSIDEYSGMCLEIASTKGYIDILDWLVFEKEYSLQTETSSGTCIMIAATNLQIDAVIWMLNNGSSIEESGNLSYTCQDILKHNRTFETVKKAMLTKSSRK